MCGGKYTWGNCSAIRLILSARQRHQVRDSIHSRKKTNAGNPRQVEIPGAKSTRSDSSDHQQLVPQAVGKLEMRSACPTGWLAQSIGC